MVRFLCRLVSELLKALIPRGSLADIRVGLRFCDDTSQELQSDYPMWEALIAQLQSRDATVLTLPPHQYFTTIKEWEKADTPYVDYVVEIKLEIKMIQVSSKYGLNIGAEYPHIQCTVGVGAECSIPQLFWASPLEPVPVRCGNLEQCLAEMIARHVAAVIQDDRKDEEVD